jgi:hypothetical protein
MTKVESIERKSDGITAVERDWQAWDREFERDVTAGRLDRLADEALADLDSGKTTELS